MCSQYQPASYNMPGSAMYGSPVKEKMGGFRHRELSPVKQRVKQSIVSWDALMPKWQKYVLGYGGMFSILYMISRMSNDSTFAITVLTIMSLFSFMFITAYVEINGPQGISVEMVEAYTVKLVLTNITMLPTDAYRPHCYTGDTFFLLGELAQMLFCFRLLYLLRREYTMLGANETTSMICNIVVKMFTNTRMMFGCYLPVTALALCLRGDFSESFIVNMGYAIMTYMEVFVHLPQLHMIHKEGKVHGWTAHFLIAQVLGRIGITLFWVRAWRENFNNMFGVCVLGSWILQLLVMVEFIYIYCKFIWRTGSFSIQNTMKLDDFV